QPDKDIKIVYTGVRPGEKLFEELIQDGEKVLRTSHAKIMALNGSLADPEVIDSVLVRLEHLLSEDPQQLVQLVEVLYAAVDAQPPRLITTVPTPIGDEPDGEVAHQEAAVALED